MELVFHRALKNKIQPDWFKTKNPFSDYENGNLVFFKNNIEKSGDTFTLQIYDILYYDFRLNFLIGIKTE